MLPPVVGTAVHTAALATCRGERINERLLTTHLGSDAVNPRASC